MNELSMIRMNFQDFLLCNLICCTNSTILYLLYYPVLTLLSCTYSTVLYLLYCSVLTLLCCTYSTVLYLLYYPVLTLLFCIQCGSLAGGLGTALKLKTLLCGHPEHFSRLGKLFL